MDFLEIDFECDELVEGTILYLHLEILIFDKWKKRHKIWNEFKLNLKNHCFQKVPKSRLNHADILSKFKLFTFIIKVFVQ